MIRRATLPLSFLLYCVSSSSSSSSSSSISSAFVDPPSSFFPRGSAPPSSRVVVVVVGVGVDRQFAASSVVAPSWPRPRRGTGGGVVRSSSFSSFSSRRMTGEGGGGEDGGEDENPLSRGINSVSWLPSVSGPRQPPPSRSILDSSDNNDDDDDNDESGGKTETLPLFPLGGIVYTPNSEHVLNIFEPRYRQMYNDILMNGSRRFVVSMCHPSEEGRFARVGVLFSLEELKEVSGMTADRVKYICNHRVTGRVRLHEVLNPEAWESRDTYLKVRGTIIDDTGRLGGEKGENEVDDDDDDDNDDDVLKDVDESIAKKLVSAVKKAMTADAVVPERTPEEEALARSFGDLVELQHDLGEDVRFTRASVRSFGVADGTDVDPNLWTSIRLWQSYAEQRLVAGQNEMQKEFQERLVDYLRKEMEKKGEGSNNGGKKSGGEELPSAIGFQDLSPELQSELIDLQKRMTAELRPLMLEQTLSMQKILEASDHEGRVGLMTYFVEAERKRLQAKKMLKNMFNGSPSAVVASKDVDSEARKAASTTAEGDEDTKSQFFADDGAFQ